MDELVYALADAERWLAQTAPRHTRAVGAANEASHAVAQLSAAVQRSGDVKLAAARLIKERDCTIERLEAQLRGDGGLPEHKTSVHNTPPPPATHHTGSGRRGTRARR